MFSLTDIDYLKNKTLNTHFKMLFSTPLMPAYPIVKPDFSGLKPLKLPFFRVVFIGSKFANFLMQGLLPDWLKIKCITLMEGVYFIHLA